MQFVHLPHEKQVVLRHRTRLVVNAAAADRQHFGLPPDRKLVLAVDHLLALRRPALVSAPSKKSFSKASWPIFACRLFRSTDASAGPAFASPPKTPAAPSSNWLFHCVIWLACTSNCSANSDKVFSPFSAVRATFALNAAVWFRRGRLLICSPLPAILWLWKKEPPLKLMSSFSDPPLNSAMALD